ncbi:hypothetical protein B9479_002758 [Cryptococcus floricola]|uniref:Uncharacterized protein n=1 Tax=Cryptococcus floricola TaxID=2591691 RepID=A0A5D3B1T6_9TREE|nr:hypothetical protein B9479_002758 [Cryptococcus floricola]
MSAHPKKRYYPPQPSRGEDRDATSHTTYSARKVAIQGPPALRTAKSCSYIPPADRSNQRKKGKGSMSWRGAYRYSGSSGAAVNASAQERPGGPPPWLQRKTDSLSATPFDSVGSPRFAASQKPLGTEAGGSHWKKKVPACPAAMASPPVPTAQPSRVQWAARAPPTQPRSLLDSNSPVSPSTLPPIMAKAPSPNSVGQPSSNMGKTQSSQPVAPHDHISTDLSHSFHHTPQPSSSQFFLDAYIPMSTLAAANSPSPPSPPSRPPALQQWFEARRRVSTDDGQSDALQQESSEISNIDKHQEGSSQDVTGGLPTGRSELGLENASTSQNVEMDDEERDVKPSAEALEKALEQAVPRVKEEDRLEGCLALTRGQLPKDVWSPNPSMRRAARGTIREQQEKELTKMGRKLVKSRWMSDGVAYDWKLVKQISLVEDQGCQIVKGDIAGAIPDLSAMDPSGAMDVDAVSLETCSGQQESETQVDGSSRHSSRRNVMALAVSAAATQPAPVSGLPMSRESSRDKRESENDVATMVSPTQTPIAVIIPSETTTSTSNRVPPSSIPAKPVTEAPASIESTSFNLPKPPSSSNPTTNPSVKPNTRPEAKWGPAIIGRPPKSGAIDRIYKYELDIPSYIQITAAGRFTPQFQTWKLKHRDDMSGQSSRGCPSREVYLNHDGPNKCKSLQVRVVPIDMQDPSSWPLSMFPDIVEYVIPDHVKPRNGEVNPRSALFRTWEKTCMDMASNPDQWGRPTRWVKSMFCPSMSKGSLRVRWRGKTATEIASYEGAPIVLPGKGDHKDKSLKDREIEMVKEREQGKVKDKGKAIHSDSQPEKRLRSELMDDQDSSRKKSRRASESNGEREWDKGKKEGVYFDEGPRSRRREKEKERGTKPSGGGRGKEKETSRERDSGWSGMDAGKAKETEKEKEKERVGHESPSKASRPTAASFFDVGPFPQAGIPATPVSGTASSPSAYAPALPPAMAMVRQPGATTSLIAEHSGSSIAGVSMSIPSTVAAGHEAPQTPTNPHPSVSMARPAPGSSTHSTPAISSPLLDELALGVRQKMSEIQTWTQMLNDFPDMVDPMRGQIDRTQTEIFGLYAKMGQEKKRLMTRE